MDPDQYMMRNQVNPQGHQRRQHHMEEYRDIVYGLYIKRGDAAMTRLIDYCLT